MFQRNINTPINTPIDTSTYPTYAIKLLGLFYRHVFTHPAHGDVRNQSLRRSGMRCLYLLSSSVFQPRPHLDPTRHVIIADLCKYKNARSCRSFSRPRRPTFQGFVCSLVCNRQRNDATHVFLSCERISRPTHRAVISERVHAATTRALFMNIQVSRCRRRWRRRLVLKNRRHNFRGDVPPRCSFSRVRVITVTVI